MLKHINSVTYLYLHRAPQADKPSSLPHGRSSIDSSMDDTSSKEELQSDESAVKASSLLHDRSMNDTSTKEDVLSDKSAVKASTNSRDNSFNEAMDDTSTEKDVSLDETVAKPPSRSLYDETGICIETGRGGSDSESESEDEHMEDETLLQEKFRTLNRDLWKSYPTRKLTHENLFQDSDGDICVDACVCEITHSHSIEQFWLECQSCGCFWHVAKGCVGFNEERAKALDFTWTCWHCNPPVEGLGL